MSANLEAIDAATDRLPEELLSRSGSVFYSGRGAFADTSRLYILGLNPGGSPVLQAHETIAADLRNWQTWPASYSRYLDESWKGKTPGTHGLQPRMGHMFDRLGIDLRKVPASNLVFVRTRSESELASEKADMMRSCWPVHAAVIETLGVDTILCLGGTAGSWAREAIKADRLIDTYSETNSRGWTSFAHRADDGRAVITLTHPGRANWQNPDSDPTPLVERVLNRAVQAKKSGIEA